MYKYESLPAAFRFAIDSYGGENFVAVRPSMVRALRGNGNAAILLTQMIFWSKKHGDAEGWFWKTREQIAEQTGLGKDAQESSRKLLNMLGLIEEKVEGMPPRVHFRLNLESIANLLVGGAPSSQSEGNGLPYQEGTAPHHIRNKLEDTRVEETKESIETKEKREKVVSYVVQWYPDAVDPLVTTGLIVDGLAPSDYRPFMESVRNYRLYCQEQAIDGKYVIGIRNFVGSRWRDFSNAAMAQRLQKRDAIRPKENVVAAL